MMGNGYVLDTGVFIEAHRRNWYRLDLNPGFWEALLHFHGTGMIRSLDRCRDEIVEGDLLADWVKDAPRELFESTADASIVNKYAEIMGWLKASDFTDAAEAEFADGADGWLVAYGLVHGLTVVTHETLKPNSKNKVKIPNVCEAFGVEWMDTFKMLQELEITFGWGAPS